MTLARRAYGWLVRALLPLARVYLRRRGRRQPAYLEHWDERFATAPLAVPPDAIWLHAVSVGETRAAAPLVAALRARFPQLPLVITQMTPTGRETARQLFPDACVRYLPYDSEDNARRFVEQLRPRFGVLMETELWPNLIRACHEAGVPLFLANARLSGRSARGYARIRPLIAPALAELAGIAAQTEDDARRLTALGARQVAVLGNTKFDVSPPADSVALAQQFRSWLGDGPVMVLASTREGEEALLLDALPAAFPARIVLVPRHPQRFDEVAALLEQRGIPYARRSQATAVAAEVRVWLGDSMGELFAYYRLATLAFVGGSLLPLGGQNPIEPASVGCPVLMGPSDFNFSAIVQAAREQGALLTVSDAADCWQQAALLLHDETRLRCMGQAGQAFAAGFGGASERIADWLVAALP